MATIDNLTLEITANSTSAVTSLDKLSTALGKLKTNLPTQAKLESSAKGFKALKDEISKLSLSAKNLDKIKAIGKIGNALSKISSISPANIKKAADNLYSLQGAISHISESEVKRIEKLASAFQKLAKANRNMGGLGSTKKIASVLAQSNTPISATPADSGVVNAQGSIVDGSASNNIQSATSSLTNFWTKYQTISSLVKQNPISLFAMAEDTKKMADIGEKLGMSEGAVVSLVKVLGSANIVIGIVTSAFSLLGKVVHKIISPIKNFVNSLKRIAMYRLLRSAIKSVSQGIREGIQNLALYSKALEGLDAHNANNVLSRYASEFLYFKNAVATAVIPVLRALIPYVETAINTIIKFIDVLAQVGSAIFGTQYTKAKYFWVDYADSLDTASGKAKKLHHQLAGFDELNNLTDNSGGSGSDKLADARNMFEEGIISPKIMNFVNTLKGKIESFLGKAKTAIQPYVDNVKEIGKGLKEKVAPQVKRILDNVKKIWDNFLSPMYEGFFKGFFEGITGESFKALPDILEKITDKIADLTDDMADFAQSIPNDKLKTMGERLGFIIAIAISNINPLNRYVQEWEFFKKTLDKVQSFIKEKVNSSLQTLAEKTEGVRFAFALFYNNILNLENPTSALSRKIEELKGKFETLKTYVDLAYFAISLTYDKFINLQNPTSYLSTLLGNLKDNFENVRSKVEEAKRPFSQIKEVLKFVASYALDTKNNLSGLKDFFARTNVFKKGEDDAKPFLNILEDIVDIVDWFTRLGKIAIKFGIELTGLNDLKNALDRIAKALDMEDLKKKLQDNLSGVGDFDYSGKDDTTDGRATLPSDERDKGRNRVTHRATGGFVTRGDLFIANEAGAEMIGKIGGDTAVANNDQITEAIAQATYNAMSKALSENGGTINLVVEGDGDKMFKVFQKKQREYQRKTGLAY